MADCQMYFIFGFDFAKSNCAPSQNIEQLHMCTVCGSLDYHLSDMFPSIPEIQEWKEKLNFCCPAHGNWVSEEWLAKQYPKINSSLRPESGFWVCPAHLDPEKFKRDYENNIALENNLKFDAAPGILESSTHVDTASITQEFPNPAADPSGIDFQKGQELENAINKLSSALEAASNNGFESVIFDYPVWRVNLASIWGHTHPHFFDWLKTPIEQVLLPEPQLVAEFSDALDEVETTGSNLEFKAIVNQSAVEMYLIVGDFFLRKALLSGVLNTMDKHLLNSNDKQSKVYVSLAIRYFRKSREKAEALAPDDVGELITTIDNLLAQSYLTLYQLVWAHSNMARAIRILGRSVNVVPTHPELWNRLGKAYELLTEERLDAFQISLVKGENANIQAANSMSNLLPRWMAGIYLLLMRVLLFLIWRPFEFVYSKLTLWIYHKKAEACYLKAQQLQSISSEQIE